MQAWGLLRLRVTQAAVTAAALFHLASLCVPLCAYCTPQYSQNWFAPIGASPSASLSAALDACCTDSFALARCDLQPITLPCDLPEATDALRTCDAERVAELAETALRVRNTRMAGVIVHHFSPFACAMLMCHCSAARRACCS